jgi:hypothetical protein
MTEDDDIPANVYRECALRLLPVLHRAMEWCSTSREQMWASMFALSHPNCVGRSMSDVAGQIKVSKATISELATRFCEENNLPPSQYMRTEENQEQARLARKGLIERHKQRTQTK